MALVAVAAPTQPTDVVTATMVATDSAGVATATIVATAPVATATATTAPSVTINPGSSVEFQLYGSDLCIGFPDAVVGANMFLTTCGAPGTIFDLPSGAPTESTQLVLSASRSGEGPIVCVNARDVAINNPLRADVCEDDQLERWRIVGGSGTGTIVSTGTSPDVGVSCLSAPTNTQGSPVTFGSCTGGYSQQWNTIVLSDN
ncbi:hypothetical protein PENSPDRAFT_160410 [Peniophora sp. CONT]|nr:hypothetical protein PENSPDRAFT_160410 [Peniophora sp. CONT]